MKITQRLLIILTLMVFATGTAWAVNNGVGNDCQGRSCEDNGKGGGGKMPEMDAASSTSAIALLTGIVLLMKERKRSKRSSDSDE